MKETSDHGWFHDKRHLNVENQEKLKAINILVNCFPGGNTNDLKHYTK